MNCTNFVVLVGRAGMDAKSGSTKTGTLWANCSLATEKYIKDQASRVTWHRVVAFGEAAKTLAGVKKGDRVYVEGELENNQYTDKQGAVIKTIQVIARQVLIGLDLKADPKQEEFDENVGF